MAVMTTTPTAPRGALNLAAGLLTATVALYIALVAFGNITDFGTNQAFVQHVLAMDTTFKDDDLMWRAITNKGLQNAAYVAIIVWETVSAIVLVYASWLWARRDTARARSMATYGLLMLLLLFGAGFIAIGGEWFSMWQSKNWNGLDSALRVVVLSGLALIVVQLSGVRTAVSVPAGQGPAEQRPAVGQGPAEERPAAVQKAAAEDAD
jgi:predicted small integral membrane protein